VCHYPGNCPLILNIDPTNSMSRLFNKSSLNPAHRQTKTGGGYLFLPRPMTRGTFLKWLRRTHAWIGLWGAALGMGAPGAIPRCHH
jgi:hypothetical protein